MQGIIPALMAWDGPKLEPLTTDIENALQIIVQAGNLLDKPLHLERKIDEEQFEIRDITDVSDNYVQRAGANRYTRIKSFPELLYKLDFNGERADITHSTELMEHLGGDAFGWVPTEKLPGEVRGMLKLVREMDLDPAIDALYSLINATRLLPLEEVDAGVERRMNDREIFMPDDDVLDEDAYEEADAAYNEIRQSIEDEIIENNYKTIRLNRKLLEALEKVKDFVGYDEDVDYFDDDAPLATFATDLTNVSEDDYAANEDRVRDLRAELKSECEGRPNEQQEMEDDAGFSE
jgi:hypothetical protein